MNDPIRIAWVVDEPVSFDEDLNDYYTAENIDLESLLRNLVFGNSKLSAIESTENESYDAKSAEIVLSNVTILNVYRINRARRKNRKRLRDFNLRYLKIMTDGLNPHIIIYDTACILASRLSHASCLHQIGSCAFFKTDEGLLMITNYNEGKTLRLKHISALVGFIRESTKLK